MNPNSSTLGKEDCDDEPEIQFIKRRVRPTTRRILANGSNLNVINLDDSDEDIHHSASQFNTIIDLVEEDVSIEMVLAEDSKLLCPCHNAETVDDISSLLHPASYRRAKTSNILHGIAQVASRSNNMQQTVHSKIVKSYHICKLMPGAVNMIAQSGYYCGIAGATSTEENCEDANQSYINPHSVSSTVGMYSNKQDRLYIPSKGHVEKKTKENTVLYMHSAVTSISFDPIQHGVMTSVGADRCIIIWDLQKMFESSNASNLASTSKKKNNAIAYEKLSSCPLEVAYMPNKSIFAAGLLNGQVLFYDHTVKIGKTTIASSSVHHQVADLCWGADFTSHLFCATSITTGDEEADSRGFHQIFDITKMQGLCRLDAKDAGHVCATSNDGRSLFLATRGSIFQNTLWQYDLARKDSHSISHIQLLPCFNRNQGKVTYISHSPDNIYLAVSGSCNQIHIYDSRFLGKGPLFQYAHTSSIAYTSSGSYGVVKADWSSGHAGGQYLISGGADGCIRVWDTNRAHERDNGWVWFNMNYDIGHFSLGNVDNGEKALIVGSLAGDVYSLD